MADNLIAFIQIDDNTPADQPAFSNEASTWNLEADYGLWGCKDYDFIGAISGVRSRSGGAPLIEPRGLPKGSKSRNQRSDPARHSAGLL